MLRDFLVNESGQGMVEYVLIIAFIALAVIAAITALGISLNERYEGIADAF